MTEPCPYCHRPYAEQNLDCRLAHEHGSGLLPRAPRPTYSELEEHFDELAKAYSDAGSARVALEAEVVRLRAALARILRCPDDHEAELVARAALKEGPDAD